MLASASGCGQDFKQENKQLKAAVSTLTEKSVGLESKAASLQKEVDGVKAKLTAVTAQRDALKKQIKTEWKPKTKGAIKKGEKKVEKLKNTAIIETKYGDIEIKLFRDAANKHVENFITLAEKGFYNGTIFHRVIPGFMIQGGDPNTKTQDVRSYGMGGPGYTIPAEFSDKPHKRGILSMARSQDPNSAGSQFFIVVKDSNFLDRQYTVFGEVTKGMEAVDKIVNLPRNPNDLPNERVEMRVRIVE
ncbi:MAG: peptidylprolyl isomerase [Deltaproteobacteria bacterium]|nr:peptidylprolyl isomerase [Deltaproteobacteria bacterium]